MLFPRKDRYQSLSASFIQVFGWSGVVAAIGAYTAINLGFLLPTSLAYPLLNIYASIAISVETYAHKDYQPFWMNVILGAIALIALGRVLLMH